MTSSTVTEKQLSCIHSIIKITPDENHETLIYSPVQLIITTHRAEILSSYVSINEAVASHYNNPFITVINENNLYLIKAIYCAFIKDRKKAMMTEIAITKHTNTSPEDQLTGLLITGIIHHLLYYHQIYDIEIVLIIYNVESALRNMNKHLYKMIPINQLYCKRKSYTRRKLKSFTLFCLVFDFIREYIRKIRISDKHDHSFVYNSMLTIIDEYFTASEPDSVCYEDCYIVKQLFTAIIGTSFGLDAIGITTKDRIRHPTIPLICQALTNIK